MGDKITVIQAIYGLKYGGAEKLLVPLCAKLDPDRYRVIVVALTCSGPVEEELRARGVDVRVLRRDGKFSPVTLIRLIGVLKSEKAKIIHTHLQNADIWAGIAAKYCRIKHISTFHGAFYPSGLLEPFKQKLRVIFPDKIIAVSKSTRDYLVSRLKADEEKVSVVYNGVELSGLEGHLDVSTKKRGLGVDADSVLLLSFGRLEIEKGHRYLIEAIGQFKKIPLRPKITVLIAGEGSQRKKLESLASLLGVADIVKFIGARPDIPGILMAADIIVNPSLSEGFPVSCLEAMSFGKAQVATNVGGVPELLENGLDCYLVAPKDPLALAEAVSILSRDRALRAKLGANARIKVLQKFSAEKMVESINTLYGELLGKG